VGKELTRSVVDGGGRMILRESFPDGPTALDKICEYLDSRFLESVAEDEGPTRLLKLELRATNGKRVNLDCQFVTEAWWRERRRRQGRHD
jgi:hypothetical protein